MVIMLSNHQMKQHRQYLEQKRRQMEERESEAAVKVAGTTQVQSEFFRRRFRLVLHVRKSRDS